MHNRRSFFKTLAAAAAATWADVVVGPVAEVDLLAEINRVTLQTIYPSVIEDQFFKASPLLAHYRDQSKVFSTGSAPSNFL